MTDNAANIEGIDDISAKLDAIDVAIDKVADSIENSDISANQSGNEGVVEETDNRADEINALRDKISAQEKTLDRMVKQIERMVLYSGAHISDQSDGRGVEAFSVEPKLGNDLPPDVPQLEDIKLGS